MAPQASPACEWAIHCLARRPAVEAGTPVTPATNERCGLAFLISSFRCDNVHYTSRVHIHLRIARWSREGHDIFNGLVHPSCTATGRHTLGLAMRLRRRPSAKTLPYIHTHCSPTSTRLWPRDVPLPPLARLHRSASITDASLPVSARLRFYTIVPFSAAFWDTLMPAAGSNSGGPDAVGMLLATIIAGPLCGYHTVVVTIMPLCLPQQLSMPGDI
ncbi:hypothetical protein P154DRAFT_570096 [Amniculicola lignicola CBS 123094]|uniref:Uncharacterized protein n=1 Tax=Amniculicola lignicola CBS 123094 TaxID=1392246 RepID=A0A6A5X093_9PLEO|nr:hypothetical protein P154DRAFT_570096 [Amniculicola lignicola CBS 123094]